MKRYALANVEFGVKPTEPSDAVLSVSEIAPRLYYLMGHDLGRNWELQFKNVEFGSPDLSRLPVNLEDGDSRVFGEFDSKSIAVFANSAPLNAGHITFPVAKLLLLIERTFDDGSRGWCKSRFSSVHSLVKLHEDIDDLLTFLADVLLDIAIANSPPYATVVGKIIERIGLQGFYRKKAEYFSNADSFYGPIQHDAGYVSISSIARHQTFDKDSRAIVTIQLWDQFLFDTAKEYLPSKNEVSNYLSQLKVIGGQLPSPEKIERELSELDAGWWVMLFVRSSMGRLPEISSYIGGSGESESLNGTFRFFQLNGGKDNFTQALRGKSQKLNSDCFADTRRNLLEEKNVVAVKFLVEG